MNHLLIWHICAYTYLNYLRGGGGVLIIVQAVLMHDPISLLAMRRTSCVKDKRFPHANPPR